MSKPIDLRHSLARGYLFTGILYGATVLLTLVLCSFAVGSAIATRRIEDRLQSLGEGVGRTVASVAYFEAEPSPSAWARVQDLHALLQETARGAGLPPGGAATDLARLTAEVLRVRFIRLGDAVSQLSLERLSSPGTPAMDMGQALRTLQRPAADFLRTLEQVGAETERALARAEDDRARFAAFLLVLVAVVAVVGCVGATVFLAGFARITTRDVRVLASFAAKVARGDYPDDKLPDRADGLGDLAAALRKVTRLEKALYDVRDLTASFEGRSRELDTQIGGTVARVTGQAARTEKAVRTLDDIVQAIQTVYTAARRSLETAEESGRDIDRSVATLLEGAREVAQLGSLTIRIEEIVALISSIADQTDILSLNAGIEAARAGAYGRGFNVVASEIRKLADKSGRSALEISELTQSILDVVQKIAVRSDEESAAMSAIQKGLSRVTEAVVQVTDVSAGARDNVEGLSKAIDEITVGVIETQREATEIAKSARGLRGDVERLRGLGSELAFPVSTASFAAWTADGHDAAAAPAPGGGRTPGSGTAPSGGAQEPPPPIPAAAAHDDDAGRPASARPAAAAVHEEPEDLAEIPAAGSSEGADAAPAEDGEEIAELETAD